MASLLADTRPLRVPAFRRLWTAQIITVVGAQLTVVAVPAQIYAETGSSAYVGLTGLFGLVPLVVFGLWGGALADHVDRRSLNLTATAGLIVTSGLFWLQALLGVHNVWAIMGLLALQQAFFGISQPTRGAILPKILPLDLLPAANSLSMTVAMAGSIAGPMLAGVLIPVTGFAWLYGIDTITLFATLAAAWSLPRMPVENAHGSPGFRSVIDGFGYAWGRPVLLASFVVDLVAMVFGMPRALFPEMASVSFGDAAADPSAGGLAFSVLYAAMPVGAVLGGVFSGWVSAVRRQGRAVLICVILWGLAVVGFGLTVGRAQGPDPGLLLLAGAFLAFGGAADMASSAFRQSILQGAAGDAVRGRLQGVFTVVVVGGPRIADVLHGGVGEVLGAVPTTVAGGVLVVVLTLVCAGALPSFVGYVPESTR